MYYYRELDGIPHSGLRGAYGLFTYGLFTKSRLSQLRGIHLASDESSKAAYIFTLHYLWSEERVSGVLSCTECGSRGSVLSVKIERGHACEGSAQAGDNHGERLNRGRTGFHFSQHGNFSGVALDPDEGDLAGMRRGGSLLRCSALICV